MPTNLDFFWGKIFLGHPCPLLGSPLQKTGVDSTCQDSMAPGSKAERKAALDAGAWMFNVVTSVGIIMVNKALMATHGFSFGKTVPNLSFL
jgi:hypothetical protein